MAAFIVPADLLEFEISEIHVAARRDMSEEVWIDLEICMNRTGDHFGWNVEIPRGNRLQGIGKARCKTRRNGNDGLVCCHL